MALAPKMSPNLSAAVSGYQPDVNSAIRRSQYLYDFLNSSMENREPIRSGWELGARLLATAVANRGEKKATAEAAQGIQAQQEARNAALIESLGGGGLPPQVAPQAQQQQPVAPAPAVAPVQSAPLAPLPVQGGSGQSPRDRELLARMVYSEAAGEGPEGQAAAAHVAMNRLNRGHGGAKSLADVIMAPRQFEGMTSPRANIPLTDPRMQQTLSVVDQVLGGQMPDPTGGAVNFLNPQLQAQMGRRQPAWAPEGQGQRIGQHVFYGGNPQAAPQQAPVPPQGQPPMGGGMGQPSMIGQPQGDQIADPFNRPQPQQAAPPQQGNVSYYQPDPREIEYVKQLLANPQTRQQGEAFANQLRQKMVTPQRFEVSNINGVPVLIDPTGRTPPRPVGVPQEAMSRTVTPQQAGLNGVPQGTVFQQDPLGKLSPVYQPPEGLQTGQGGGMAFTPIPGSQRDPTSPMNAISGEQQLRGEFDKKVQDYIMAREGYQKVINAANTATPAGDIALVFGYMKTLDPGSTVREGEQATVQNSGTIPETITNMYNKMVSGTGSISPAQRQQFVQSAGEQFKVYQNTANDARDRYSQLARSYGYDPSRVVRDFPEIQGAGSPPAGQSQGQGGGGPAPPPGAKRGQDGNFYVEDPNRKGSFPRLQLGPNGVWQMRSANGQLLDWAD